MSDQDFTLDTYVERLLEEKGLHTIEDEVRTQMAEELKSRVHDFINVGLLEAMPEEKYGDFEALLDRDAPEEEYQAFINENVPNVQEVFAKALMKFRATYLQNS